MLRSIKGLGFRVSGLSSAPALSAKPYFEGQGDLVSSLISLISHIVTLNIPIINLLTKSP